MRYFQRFTICAALVLGACTTTATNVSAAQPLCLNASDEGYETFDEYLRKDGYNGIPATISDADKVTIMDAASAKFGELGTVLIGVRENPLGKKVVELQIDEPYEEGLPPSRPSRGCVLDIQ